MAGFLQETQFVIQYDITTGNVCEVAVELAHGAKQEFLTTLYCIEDLPADQTLLENIF